MTTTLIRRAGVLALIAATTTTLTGCAGVLGARMTYNDTETTKITDIVVTGGEGDVTVTTATTQQTTIKRVVRGSSNPGESYKLIGTTLNVDTTCGPDCSVSYEIQAPAGVAVRGQLRSGDIGLDGVGTADVRLTSGNVTVHNATGPVQVHATSGDIEVLDAKGAVTAQSTSGNVKALNVGGAVDVRATSGDVDVKLTAANSVRAVASSGDVNVVLPQGTYKISTDTGSGNASVHGLTSDPAAKNVIDVRTASGDVEVAAAA
jgi:DUF4097 and DUF4098 domain-containing protein YvlB